MELMKKEINWNLELINLYQIYLLLLVHILRKNIKNLN